MTTWRRLRILEAEYSVQTELLSIAEALHRVSAPTEALRSRAAEWLERLAANEKALQALTARKGRKRSARANYIALDYLVQKELLGKAAAAERDVATAWNVKPKTVQDAWTDSQLFARQKLENLTAARIGETRGMKRGVWTRRTLLEDISADLRDQHAKPGRKK